VDLIDRSKINFYHLTGPELRSAIEEAPTVPAVPLDKLCEYLSVTCACPPKKEEIQKRCLTAQCALCWKESITKWMEEQDAAD
jgi:hypothetical protein